MKTILTGICTASVFFALSSAQAADLPVEPVAVAPAPIGYDWTGFYVGAHLGYGWDDAHIRTNGGFWGVGSTSTEPDSWLGGVQLGYWWQMTNNVVWGIDGSYSWTDMSDSTASPAFPGTDTWTSKVNGIALIQGRVGWANDRWLIFAQGGYAGLDGEAKGFSTVGPTRDSDSNWHNGWTVGAGVLYGINEHFSVGAEYNYIDAGSESYNWSNGGTTARVDHEIHALKITGSYHFNLFGP